MSIIVIEGPDGAGKTTLLTNLRKHDPNYFWTFRPSRPPESLDQILQMLWWMTEKPVRVKVAFDRHPIIGELVYGPIFREGSKVTQDWGLRMLKATVSKIIYCCPPWDMLIAGVKQEKQMDGVIEKLSLIYTQYNVVMSQLRLAGIEVVDYNRKTTDYKNLNIWENSSGIIGTEKSILCPRRVDQAMESDRAEEFSRIGFDSSD